VLQPVPQWSVCTRQSDVSRSGIRSTYRLSAVAVLRAAVAKFGANADLVFALGAASAISGDGAGRGGGRASGGASGRRTRGRGGRITVPVGLGLVHALTHGDTLEATGLEGLDHGDGQVEGSELVNVVGDGELALRRRVGAVDSSAEVVLGGLNLDGSELVVVIGVQIEVRNDVSKLLHNALASGLARRVRRTHVSGVFADDVADSHLVLDHLIVDLSLGNLGQILVGPSVGGDLVTFGDHTLDNRSPFLINSTLADVNTSDKEGSLEARRIELVQNLVSVDVWAIIVGDSDSSWLAASVDASTAVRDAPLLSSDIVAGSSSSWGLVGITARAVVEKTVRSVAVLRSVSTVSLMPRK
jgi:hypothetical protein